MGDNLSSNLKREVKAHPALLAGWVLLAVVIYLADLAFPLGVAGGVPYMALVLLAAWMPWRHAIMVTAGIATVLAILGYIFSRPSEAAWMVFTNQGLALFAIWVTAILLLARKRLEDQLLQAGAKLEGKVAQRTAELETANALLRNEIAEHKRTLKALRESEVHLGGIMDHVVDGIVTTDESGVIQSFNAAAERIFGYLAAEVCGQPVNILMAEPDRSQHLRYFQSYLTTGKSRIIEIGPRQVTALRKDGSQFPMELDISEMRFDGKCCFIGITRDITERTQTERRLRQAQKIEAIGHLTGGAAHDFNNILMVAIGNLDLIREGIENPALQGFLETALKALHRGADLTQRLLAFSRRQALNPEVTNMNGLVSGMTELMRHTIGAHIEVETVLAGGLWQAVVDPGQLENALLNLVINARDAMPDGGKLTIETANVRLSREYADRHEEVKPGQYVMVAVSDTGTGMTVDVAERAFDPFFTTKDVGEGSGLGLSMVYGFTKQTGGHVKIYSEVGQGTTVKLYLPKATAADLKAANLKESSRDIQVHAMPTGNETILVVEDDPDVRAFVVMALGGLGYRLLEAESGPAVTRLLDEIEHVDLVFTDVVLPHGANGRQVAEKVKQRFPRVSVLFTSGYTENAVVHHGRLDEDAQLLAKPYKRSELARAVREMLDKNKES